MHFGRAYAHSAQGCIWHRMWAVKKNEKCDAFKNITNKKIVLVFDFWRAGPWSFSTGRAAAEKTRGVAKKPARGHEMNTQHIHFSAI